MFLMLKEKLIGKSKRIWKGRFCNNSCWIWKNSIDEQFNNNTLGCAENGIPYGIYWYSYAQTAEDAVEEAKNVLKL